MTVSIESSPQYLGRLFPAIRDKWLDLRADLYEAGPLSRETLELILITSFATLNYEGPFKFHAKKAKAMGVSREMMQHAVLVTFTSTTNVRWLTEALSWIEEVFADELEEAVTT